MTKNITSFKVGNKAAEKWTEEEAVNSFELALELTLKDKDILCVQDAFFAIPMRPTTAHYLMDKFPVLEDIKKDINDRVISRVNKGALEGDYNPTAGIWRMKQLGERDERHIDQTVEDKRKTVNDLFPTEDELNEED
jgi:hypothetical protein